MAAVDHFDDNFEIGPGAIVDPVPVLVCEAAGAAIDAEPWGIGEFDMGVGPMVQRRHRALVPQLPDAAVDAGEGEGDDP
jgi:hypothetical protein